MRLYLKSKRRIYANSFYGSGSGDGIGSGNGTSWSLAGRKLSTNSKIVQKCDIPGTVIVKIWVNRDGKIVKKERAGGSNNPCLVNPALDTAETYKWLSDSNAPEIQIGYVKVTFF